MCRPPPPPPIIAHAFLKGLDLRSLIKDMDESEEVAQKASYRAEGFIGTGSTFNTSYRSDVIKFWEDTKDDNVLPLPSRKYKVEQIPGHEREFNISYLGVVIRVVVPESSTNVWIFSTSKPTLEIKGHEFAQWLNKWAFNREYNQQKYLHKINNGETMDLLIKMAKEDK